MIDILKCPQTPGIARSKDRPFFEKTAFDFERHLMMGKVSRIIHFRPFFTKKKSGLERIQSLPIQFKEVVYKKWHNCSEFMLM